MFVLARSIRTQVVFSLLFVALFFICTQSASASTISGVVYDKQRTPMIDVDVELLDDLYRQNKRTRTDGSGRFQFDTLSDGRWVVKVSPFRYDYLDQTQQFEINTMTITGTGNGNAFINADFYLTPKKGGLADSETGVIFAQEIPSEAKKSYEKGIKELGSKKEVEGLTSLNKAVEIFPDYYQALMRLGLELFKKKMYQDAARFYYKAAQVNPKSGTAFHMLGLSFHHIGPEYDKAALAALKKAAELAPASATVLLGLGIVERATGDLPNAEKHLLLAKKNASEVMQAIQQELVELYSNDLKKYAQAADELELFIKNGNLSDAESKDMKARVAKLREKAKAQASN